MSSHSLGRWAWLVLLWGRLAMAGGVEGKVLLWPLQSLGLEEAAVGEVVGALKGAAARVPGVSLILPEDLAKLKDSPVAALMVSSDDAQLAQTAQAAGARYVLTGVMAGMGNSYSVTLRLTAVGGVAHEVRVSALVRAGKGMEEDLLQALTEAMRPDLYVGSLEIRSGHEGAKVFLDERLMGQTPLAGPLEGVAPGKHSLRIEAPGFSPLERFVEVAFGKRTVMEVKLSSATIEGVIYREGLPPAVSLPELPREVSVGEEEGASRRGRRVGAWVCLGVAGAAAAVGLGFGIAARMEEMEFYSLGDANGSTGLDISYPEAQAMAARAGDRALAANILFVAAGAAAVTSLVLFLVSLEPEGPAPAGPAQALLRW